MTNYFVPRLEILPPSQQFLWDELEAVPAPFVLCDGTAIALHLGHRSSVDFDFFGSQEFDPDQLALQIPFLRNAEVLQKAASTLT